MCEQDVVHVYSRESGMEVLRLPAEATVRCSQRVGDPLLVSRDRFTTPIVVSPDINEFPCPKFIAGVFNLNHTLLVHVETSFSLLE